MCLKLSTHLRDIGKAFAIGRKRLSVNRTAANFLKAKQHQSHLRSAQNPTSGV